MGHSKRRETLEARRLATRAAKAAGEENPHGKSVYARKRKYLEAHGGSGLDYPQKPWK